MHNPLLTLSFEADAAIARRRIVKHDTTDDLVIQAAAAADKLLGVVDIAQAGADGERVDVVLVGVAEVEYGGTVARGDLLTSDADGKAVVGAAGNRIIGEAMVSGVDGDIGSVNISPGIHT